MTLRWLRWLGLGGSLVGVDLGSASVKVVQLGFGRKGVLLQYAGLTELGENGAAAAGSLSALHELFARGRSSRARLALNFAERSPVIRYVTLPAMPREELAEAVRWEAKKLIPQPLEDLVLDFLIMGEQEERGAKRLEIVLVAAERTAVRAQLESLGPLRPRVTAVDVNPLALLNTVKLNYKADLDQSLAYVDIGAAKMDISIAKNGVLRFTRAVQIGGEEMTTTVMRDLGIERGEAERLKRQTGLADGDEEQVKKLRDALKGVIDRVVLEVQRSIDYYRAQFRESDIRKIVLMGGTPLLPGFQEYFAGYFDVATEIDDPFAEIICDDPAFGELRLMAPRFSSSVGLALRGAA